MTGDRRSEAPTLGIFSSIAGRYDLANRVTSFGLDQGWRRFAARRLGPEGAGDVLDLAAGTGDLAIADVRYGKAVSVTATDVNEEMMALGRAKVEARGLADRITFAFVDAQDLPFEDARFDGVTVGFGVRNFEDRRRAFAEVLRVLKPGRRFVCLEFSRPRARIVKGPYLVYLRHAVPALGRLLTGDRESYEYLAESIQAFPPPETLAAMLLDAGFSDARWTDLALGAVAVHVATK